MKNKNKEKIANIISNVFNAYIGILLSYILVIFVDNNNIPNWISIIVLSTIILSIVPIFFKQLGLISDFEVSNRKERPLYNLAMLIPTLVIISIALSTNSYLFLITSIIIFLSIAILGIVSIFWKMSGHLLSLSILFSIASILFFKWYLPIIFLIILISVAWSRVELKRHTILQTIIGSITGILLVLLFF